MGKKKKNLTMTSYLDRFVNETLSVTISDIKEAEKVIEELKSKEIRYCVGDLPKMHNGKVVGCSKHITVMDGERLQEVLKGK